MIYIYLYIKIRSEYSLLYKKNFIAILLIHRTILDIFRNKIQQIFRNASDVSNDVIAYDRLSTPSLHGSAKLVKVWSHLVQTGVGLVKEGFGGLESHRTRHPFSAFGLLDSNSLRHACNFPPHVDQKVLGHFAAGVRLQFCRIWALWKVHPVFNKICKAVVSKNQRLPVTPSS